ncbi:MAG: sel1 repeat family protein [Candidatus Riflebacteria bacterium]|nr:sel1 repeat family protein [Candidatus Riflebacteria bacterium]
MRKMFMGVILMVGMGSGCWADLAEAERAMMRYDFATARSILLPMAEAGDPRAQVLLADVASLNYPGDPVEVEKWLRKAAAQGDAEGQRRLSIFLGRSKSSEALEWLERSAAQGNASALTDLGVKLTYGEDCPIDFQKAARCFAQAAATGDGIAQAWYGDCFRLGQGVPPDDERAYFWLKLAVDRDERVRGKDWERDLGRIASRLSQSQRDRLDKEVSEWQPSSSAPPPDTDPASSPSRK